MHFHQDFWREAYVCSRHPCWHRASFTAQLFLSSPQSPIIGTQRSLRCARRCSGKDSSTCTHTHTSSSFHLLHQTLVEEARAPIPNQRSHFLSTSGCSVHTNESLHICAQKYTLRVHKRGLLTMLWWTNVQVIATPPPKEFHLPFFIWKLLGSQS